MGCGGILKQHTENSAKQVVIIRSGLQENYSTTKKNENLSIILCISKSQGDLYNKIFLLRIDRKSTKGSFTKKMFKT